MKKDRVFVIVGPTSSGKTNLAVDLCKKFNGEIVSADSRQIYKYMDIGKGKVSAVSTYIPSSRPQFLSVRF